MNYKLCVFDMDGTVLDSNSSIPKRNIDALKRLARRGVQIVIATGRMDAMVKNYMRQIGLDLPVISCNGGLIRKLGSDNAIAEFTIQPEKIIKFINICRSKGAVFHMYSRSTMFTEKIEGRAKFFYEYNKTLPEEDKIDIRLVRDCTEVVLGGTPIIKGILCPQDENIYEAVRLEVEKIEGMTLVQSGSGLYDFMRKDVSKGSAVRCIADNMGISKQEIAAFGDNHNDISMLMEAGLSVAMGNAEEEVKKHASFVTLTNDESGVAYAIEKFIL
ncbi:hypothetical protein SAMN02745945_00095 [Peptoclostridium litorale DSM 5388]|uniref:Hydrolase n=1 Tax=Peptoclostridium litorale DSM 5388 TaxID=1121324 RepID=A0A069RKL5_PEPLI|nr:Cof-type HAD-IIB family hydrolase [Peptoclostridium litorale]KDR96655.1 hydrolase [Peptoclostridium litorale DSM 5388]SIN68021.1 hypothetical protein SAMN02745945_00095 [Peptoclostridium litorale DSM 5388]